MSVSGKSFYKTERDIVTLSGLRVFAKHGYYDFEREKGNNFEIDLMAAGHFTPSIHGDDLSRTFDYAAAEKIIVSVFNGPSEKLIETLCERTGREIMQNFSIVEELTVALRKCNPPIGNPASYAEIKMSWKRS